MPAGKDGDCGSEGVIFQDKVDNGHHVRHFAKDAAHYAPDNQFWARLVKGVLIPVSH